ncbi:MAG: ROK family protein [Candidatus Peribacteraceae bacterium]|nr:ROK family protein [Candidatus Peribacteraceae bacterium]MDD5742595.1 ROK family protein [Candidatus Peribacteraceae bacterium]
MPETLHIVSGDLGGNNCRSAVMTFDDNEPHLEEGTYRSWKSECEEDLGIVLDRGIGDAIHDFHGRIAGASLAIAGPVDDHRIALNAPNIRCLRSRVPYDLAAEMSRRFGGENIAGNDLEVACAGEMEQGALKGKKWAMLENFGTGYGGARLFNGVAVAAEPGHMWLPNNEARCGCGKTDCTEATLSGGAIRRRIQGMHDSGAIVIPAGLDPCAFADQESMKGTEWAVNFYTGIARDIGDIWGSNLNNCPLMTDIVFMGSFLERAMKIEFFRQQVREAMLARSMFSQQHANVGIYEVSAPRLPSGESLGPLYGAASVWKRLHGERHHETA